MDPAADSLTPASIVFPTLAFIALLFDIPPLVWHAKNRNVAACNLISWTILTNLFSFINALLWPTDNFSRWFPGYVLCDIEAKLLIAATFAISGSLACIMRALANVLDTENTIIIPTKKQRYREAAITGLLCFGAPLYIIATHYIVQPSRYYIMSISGCTTSIDDSWLAIVLVIIWPPILCLTTIYYALVVIFRMRKYRRDFSSILSAANSNLTESRFLRVFLLSTLLVLIFLPLQAYTLYTNASHPLTLYNWKTVHEYSTWMDIIMVPQHGVVPLDRWITIILGFLIFIFFGLGSDATKMYRKWWSKFRLAVSSSSLYGHPEGTHLHSPTTKHGSGSLATLLHSFYRRSRSSPRSSMSQLEKRNTATTITTLGSPVESEKFSHAQHMAPATASAIKSTSAAEAMDNRPLPLVPAQSKPSWLGHHFSRSHDHSPPNDIESALERHDNHRPNRFLAGLWHVNNAGNSAPMPATHGICMGSCNGMKL